MEQSKQSEQAGADELQTADSNQQNELQPTPSAEGDAVEATSESSVLLRSPTDPPGPRNWMDKIVDGPRNKSQGKSERLRRSSVLAPGEGEQSACLCPKHRLSYRSGHIPYQWASQGDSPWR